MSADTVTSLAAKSVTPAAAAPGRFVMPAASREEIRAGIFYMLASVTVFAVINAIIKWQSARYPLDEVVFFRCVFSLLPCSAIVIANGGLGLLRTHRLREHVGRGTLQFISMMCIFSAFAMMPLADAIAISFSSPLFLTMLSIPLLGERVGPHRWGAVLAGFAGVLLMMASGGEFGGGFASTGAVLALTSAAIGASVGIAVRRMTLTESSAALVTYQALVTTALCALLLPFAWCTPTWLDLMMMAGAGLCSGIGQFWWTQACRYAPASVTAPFGYTSMLWSLLLGYFIWGDMPTTGLIAGALVVAASGLYILYRETLRRTPQPAPAAIAPRQG